MGYTIYIYMECAADQKAVRPLNSHTHTGCRRGAVVLSLYTGKWSLQNKIFIVAVDKLAHTHILAVYAGVCVWENADVLTSVYLSIISGKLSSSCTDIDVDVRRRRRSRNDVELGGCSGSLPNALKDQTCPHTHAHTLTHIAGHLLIQTKPVYVWVCVCVWSRPLVIILTITHVASFACCHSPLPPFHPSQCALWIFH